MSQKRTSGGLPPTRAVALLLLFIEHEGTASSWEWTSNETAICRPAAAGAFAGGTQVSGIEQDGHPR
jgi:hypothetical protein